MKKVRIFTSLKVLLLSGGVVLSCSGCGQSSNNLDMPSTSLNQESEDSRVDDEMLKYRNDIYNFAYDIECENNFNISISPIIKNIDKFNYWLETLPFYINVNKEGVVLSES